MQPPIFIPARCPSQEKSGRGATQVSRPGISMHPMLGQPGSQCLVYRQLSYSLLGTSRNFVLRVGASHHRQQSLCLSKLLDCAARTSSWVLVYLTTLHKTRRMCVAFGNIPLNAETDFKTICNPHERQISHSSCFQSSHFSEVGGPKSSPLM